jgi:hypothetical protein
MGLPTPDPSDSGDDCTVCDGVLWSPGMSPAFVKATVHGIQKCPRAPTAAPDGLFVLPQDELDACIYYVEISPYILEWDLGSGFTRFRILHTGAPLKFWFYTQYVPTECVVHFDNSQQDCAPITYYGINGTVDITWP